MATDITLTSGMRANLFSLQQTSNWLEQTQQRMATGKKVNSALDDPIAFFTARGHEQRAHDLAARKDEMSESIQTIKSADIGIESVLNLPISRDAQWSTLKNSNIVPSYARCKEHNINTGAHLLPN